MKASDNTKIRICENGPYLVSGSVPLMKVIIEVDDVGCSEGWSEGEHFAEEDRYSLCRCGHSCSKPYCDGAHAAVGFDGTETAPRETYAELVEVQDGPTMELHDVEWLCAEARFCARAGAAWHLVDQTDEPEARELLKQQCADCPSGRYVAYDKTTGQVLEPELERSIGLIEDPGAGVSGPLWVRAGIPVISSDGFQYEVRNRQTLCRCGESKCKPFCDGSHIEAEFTDD